jgi:hypothetical protein
LTPVIYSWLDLRISRKTREIMIKVDATNTDEFFTAFPELLELVRVSREMTVEQLERLVTFMPSRTPQAAQFYQDFLGLFANSVLVESLAYSLIQARQRINRDDPRVLPRDSVEELLWRNQWQVAGTLIRDAALGYVRSVCFGETHDSLGTPVREVLGWG